MIHIAKLFIVFIAYFSLFIFYLLNANRWFDLCRLFTTLFSQSFSPFPITKHLRREKRAALALVLGFNSVFWLIFRLLVFPDEFNGKHAQSREISLTHELCDNSYINRNMAEKSTHRIYWLYIVVKAVWMGTRKPSIGIKFHYICPNSVWIFLPSWCLTLRLTI